MPDDLLSSGYDDILSQVGKLSKEIGKTTAPEEARMGALAKEADTARADLTRAAGEALPKVPDKPELPAKPQFQPTSPMEALGNPLIIASIFAGALTHAPLTTALNAAGSAFKGYHDGNLEAAKQAETQYKDAMDAVFKQHELEMEQYRALLEEHGQTIKGKAAVLEAIGSAYGWTNELRLAKAGRVDEALKIVDAKERMLERLRGKTVQEQLMHQWEAANPNATPEDKVKFLNSMRVGTSPQSRMLEDFRDNFESTHGRPPTAEEEADFMQKLRPPRSAQAMATQKFIEENPNASSDDIAQFAATYAARNKAVSAFATGKEGGIVRSFSTVAEHIGTMRKLAAALKNNDSKTFNAVANAWVDQFGGTAPNNFNSAKQIVGDEIVKAIVGAGGGVADREKAQSILDAARTPEQLSGAMDTLTELIHGQLTGLKKQYEDTTGRTDFDTRLTGAAKEMLTGGKKRYNVNDIIDVPKSKDYPTGKARVTGGSPEDPDVEPVK